jgi:hypothetical protein
VNHVAFDVARKSTSIGNASQAGIMSRGRQPRRSENQASKEITPSTFVRSLYFQDPDGIMLEFAAWTRVLDARDVNCEPASADEQFAAATAGR